MRSFLPRAQPVIGRIEKDGELGRDGNHKRTAYRCAALVPVRPSGNSEVGGDKGARRVHGFKHYFAAAAAAHPIAEGAQQVVGLSGFAGLNPDDFVRAGESIVELARLGQIPANELEVFGLFQFLVGVRSLVTVHHHIAGEGGKNGVRLNVGRHSAAIRANDRIGSSMEMVSVTPL